MMNKKFLKIVSCLISLAVISSAFTAEEVKDVFASNEPDNNIEVSIPIYEIERFTIGENDFTPVQEYQYENFEYNEKGQLIKRECDNGLKSTIEYTYDENGLIVNSAETSISGAQTIYSYEYDDRGNIISKVLHETNKDGQPTSNDGKITERTNEYDEKGRLVKVIDTNSKNDYNNTETFIYDDLGRVTEAIFENSNHKGDFITSYDVNGHLIRCTDYFINNKSGEESTLIYNWKYVETGYRTFSVADGYIEPAENWRSFEEEHSLPAPDYCIPVISRISQENGEYIFSLPRNIQQDSGAAYDIYCSAFYNDFLPGIQNEARIVYEVYRKLLEDVCGFELMTDENSITYISKDSVLIATLSLQIVESPCIVISFPQ